MMDIDAEDGHALMPQPQMRRCDRRVVEKTEAAGEVAIGMMSRRTAQRIGCVLPSSTSCAAVAATSVAAQAAAKVPGPIGQDVSIVCQPSRPTIWVG